jgi:hypothetical protein
VLINWKDDLDSEIYVRYSTPSGDPLIHTSPDPVFIPSHVGWGFHRFNPWRKRFDRVIVNTNVLI